MNEEKYSFSYEQVLLFTGWVGGMIFILSLLVIFEIPSIIKAGDGGSLIIILPILFFINYISIKSLIIDWKNNSHSYKRERKN